MSSSSQADTSVTPVTHLHGHWYFADLATTDLAGATAFYSRLLRWMTSDIPNAPSTYRLAMREGRSKAALRKLDPVQAAAGVGAHWFGYLTVDDLDATLARVPEHGGTVLAPAS